MDIKRILLAIVSVITLSFFYFPVTFAAFPVSNTKNLMAALGLVVIVLEISRKRLALLDKNLFTIGIIAALVSLSGLLAVTYNETPDYTYATYLGSFFLWFFSAYFVVAVIKKLHGKVGVEMICNYLVLLCVLQCISVLLIDNYPDFQSWADSTFVGLSYASEIKRLYGLGPSLDVGGSRFAAVLLLIGYMLTLERVTKNAQLMYMYIFSFLFILVVGSMVGRTTSVGGGLALLYLLWKNKEMFFSPKTRNFLITFLLVMAVGIAISIYFYHHHIGFRENVRFAFEGFFNWWETGEWETTSTNRWQTMFVWPDNMKTWLIGDGYFEGPSNVDPYYVGPANFGYYKWTDIGYLRFIFYFGLVGLVTFIVYFCKVSATCVSRFKGYKNMFLLFLLFNFVLWCKVATDIFLVFALFLCISKEENEEYENSIQRIQ